MRYQSRKPKPETGMELTVTLSMLAGQTEDEAAASIVAFMEAVQKASDATNAAWIKMRCSGVPAAFEERLHAAIDSVQKTPKLSVVVDNTRR